MNYWCKDKELTPGIQNTLRSKIQLKAWPILYFIRIFHKNYVVWNCQYSTILPAFLEPRESFFSLEPSCSLSISFRLSGPCKSLSVSWPVSKKNQETLLGVCFCWVFDFFCLFCHFPLCAMSESLDLSGSIHVKAQVYVHSASASCTLITHIQTCRLLKKSLAIELLNC